MESDINTTGSFKKFSVFLQSNRSEELLAQKNDRIST